MRLVLVQMGHAVVQLAEALNCKLERRGLDFMEIFKVFHWRKFSGRTMALG
jgi:hypothetical protein